jgi:plastocyanin
MDRRRFLVSVPAVAVGLAGCSGGGSETPEPTSEPTSTAESAPEPTESPTESPTPTPEPTPEPTPTATSTESPTPTADPTPTPVPDRTVEVGAGGLSFSPESFSVSAGDTVLWVWRGSGHNVKPSSTPEGSDWAGTPGERTETYGEGYRYSHTFETPGRYEYLCVPHQSVGMTGSFRVE